LTFRSRAHTCLSVTCVSSCRTAARC
jgi:hypothetical protein